MTPPTPPADVTVREVMRPAVTTVERTAHVAAAAYLMKRLHDNALVVLTDASSGVPVTVVCDGDVTRAVADGLDLEQARLTDLDLPAMVRLAPDTPVPDAAERMLQAAVAYAPVVEGGRLVGLVDLAAMTRGLLMGRRQDRLAGARA